MEKQLSTPLELEDLDVAPGHEEQKVTKVAATEAETVEQHRLTLRENAKELLKIAASATKADKLDRDARAKVGVGVTLPISLTMSLEPVVTAVSGHELLPVYVNLPLLLGAFSVNMMNIVNHTRKTSLPIVDGNTIQCLRIAQHTDTIKDGKTLLAIHSRNITGEDAAEQARSNMADALEVISLAHIDAKDKDQFGGVVITGSAAAHVGLSIPPRYSYKDVIEGVAEEPTNVADHEKAVVLPMSGLEEIVERLRQNQSALMGRALDELARRYPGMRESLTADNPAILSVLHTVLQQHAYSEGRHTYWKKDMVKMGDHHVWTGDRFKVIEDMVPIIDKHDPYNPVLTYRNAKTGEERSSQDLRSATGGELDPMSVIQLLGEGRVDDLKLIRTALQLLEETHNVQEAEMSRTASHDAEVSQATEPQLIGLGEGIDTWKHRRRQLFKVALGSVAILSSAQAVILGISLHSNKTSSTPVSTQNHSLSGAQHLFKVEDYGLTQQEQHWAQNTSYVFRDGTWVVADQAQKELDLPRTLAADAPHLTVRTQLGTDDLYLPIEEDTRLAALRVYDIHKKPVEVKAYQKADGTVVVDGDKTRKNTYLEYDLVRGYESNIHANKPITVEGDMFYSRGWQGTFRDAADAAGYIRSSYIYDNSSNLKKELALTHSPTEYVKHLLDKERCQCLQCNTEVALMESQVRPHQKLALVSGFLHKRDPNESHSYLVEDHAWLNDGKTIDATAERTDDKSDVPHYDDTATLDVRWNKEVEAPLAAAEKQNNIERSVLLSLLGLASLGLARLEARHRPLRHMVNTYIDLERRATAAKDIHPADARRLMGWQAYGTWASPIPDIGDSSHRDGALKEDNIPVHTLKEIADGGFTGSGHLTREQQRGLKRTAAAMLRARKNLTQREA